MGSQQQFCLRWNNHQSNMLSVFDDLFQNEALVDVTLACDGLSIKAHKMVLSACSPYFQNLFLDNPCKHPIVILKDIRFTDLKALMDFMYKGEVNVSQEQLSTLLRTAETLKVRGLTEVAAGGTAPTETSNSILPPSTPTTQNVLPTQLPRPPNGPNPGSNVTNANQAPSNNNNTTQHQQQQQQQIQQQMSTSSHRPTCSPSPKRKRVRHWHKSEQGSSGSDYEDSGDSRGHELIEPKVEITEELPDGEEPPTKMDTTTGKGGGSGGCGRSVAPTSTNTTPTNVPAESVGNSNNTQGAPSSQESSPVNDSQTSLVRTSSINATPVIFGQTPQSLTQTIGQPPVLQGTSQALPGLPILMTTSTMMNVTNAGPGTSRQDSGPRPCIVCKKVISSASNMKKHMEIHCRRIYKCEDCLTTYTYVDSLRRHLRMKHGKRLKKFLRRIPERLRPRPCKICNKIISNASNMIKHMLVHNPVKIPFRCNLCDCKYSREETLRWHLKVKHGIIRPSLGRDSYLQEITIDAVSSATSSWMSTT